MYDSRDREIARNEGQKDNNDRSSFLNVGSTGKKEDPLNLRGRGPSALGHVDQSSSIIDDSQFMLRDQTNTTQPLRQPSGERSTGLKNHYPSTHHNPLLSVSGERNNTLGGANNYVHGGGSQPPHLLQAHTLGNVSRVTTSR